VWLAFGFNLKSTKTKPVERQKNNATKGELQRMLLKEEKMAYERVMTALRANNDMESQLAMIECESNYKMWLIRFLQTNILPLKQIMVAEKETADRRFQLLEAGAKKLAHQ